MTVVSQYQFKISMQSLIRLIYVYSSISSLTQLQYSYVHNVTAIDTHISIRKQNPQEEKVIKLKWDTESNNAVKYHWAEEDIRKMSQSKELFNNNEKLGYKAFEKTEKGKAQTSVEKRLVSLP